MSQVADAFMSIFGFRRVSVASTDCPSTQAVHRARDEAYRKQHAQLLAELSAVVGKPLHRVEKIAGR